jgi:hypothetical protein
MTNKERTQMADITIQEINNRLSALVVAMLEKGLYQPKATLLIKADEGYTVALGAGHGYGNADHWYDYTYGQDPMFAIDTAFALIAAMPDPETAKLTAHMRRVADCIDKGREDGIDDAYIAPLVVVKAVMTDNLLAVQK